MCFFVSSDPIEDPRGHFRTYNGPNHFKTDMMSAPCAGGCTTCCWCLGQFIPITSGCTQYLLRRKVLDYDMSKYTCFQGQLSFCCGSIQAGACGERNCPDFCAFIEGCCCNCFAISASRMYVMERYDLQSDPCDYRLIRINNCLQLLSCFCYILAFIDSNFRECARLIDNIADLFYHSVSGCMTAQVAFEMDFHNSLSEPLPVPAEAIVAQPQVYDKI